MKNKTIKRIYEMARPHLKTIIIVSILSLLIAVAETVKPYIVKIAIDDYLSQGIYQKGIITIGMLGAIYIAIVILGNILDFIATTTTNKMGEKIIYDMRNKLFRYIQYANITFHDKTPAGKLFARITSDVEDISTLFKDVIATFIKDIVIIITIIIVILNISVGLGVISLAVIPLMLICSFTLITIANKMETVAKNYRTELNTFLAESIYGAKLIKIFNIQNEKQKECEEKTQAFCNAKSKAKIPQAILPGMMKILEDCAIALITWTCVKHWFGISIQPGVLYVFVTYIQKLFEPITRIVENVEIVQEAGVSINKIYDILEGKEFLEKLDGGITLDKVEGKIEFKNVWFSYDNKNWVLKDVSFVIEPGQSIALVGKTGSGKTTIVNLINRFYNIQKGEILIDGVNINEINLRSLREHIGMILQDPFIFADSIKENIKMNLPISDEDVKKSIELASAEEFVNNLPNGINEVAKERGSSFSAGQKQLIAFARVFAHNPNIFILDEATANIDTYTESLIQKSINKISEDKTSIFIAHRLSTIVNVDKIIVLMNGEIVEQGNHNELVATGGYYSKLYNSYYESLG